MATATWTPSAEQQAIFHWFATGEVLVDGFMQKSRHLVVRARAGCGKSSTIRAAVKLAPETNILVAAFSKIIELEMTKLIGSFAGQVKTLHSTGLMCVRKFRNIKWEFNSDRADALALKVCGRQAPSDVVRLVSKLHTKGREIAPHAQQFGDLTTIQITFECEANDTMVAMGFDSAYIEQKALEAMELAADVKDGDTIDGSDMIFLPVRNGWMLKMFDMVVVDEAQDMTNAQLELALGVLKDGGRVCIVGDDRQAIFGFRGADSGSLDRLKAELGAAELGLKTTYRCGKAIVELAQSYVADFVADANNAEGIIRNASEQAMVNEAGPGDFILSRVNAPLVSIAMKLLRSGKRARVAGKDIGKGLVTLIRKFKARSVPALLAQIEAWATREVTRQNAAMSTATNGRKKALQAKIEAIQDQADMLVSLTDGAKSVDEVTARIEALFTDPDNLGMAGVTTCSSVHRAKGLEADRVFVLRETLRETNDEERNITYVAITRAKHELVWVSLER